MDTQIMPDCSLFVIQIRPLLSSTQILNINNELKDSPLGEILITSLKRGVDSGESGDGGVLVSLNSNRLFDSSLFEE